MMTMSTRDFQSFPDFYGKNCQESEDNCSNVQCPNGGKCVDGVGEHFCECPSPIEKTGSACDKGEKIDVEIAGAVMAQ